MGKELSIRVGGSFVWPPSGIPLDKIKKIIFIAGGVGIKYVPSQAYLLTPAYKIRPLN